MQPLRWLSAMCAAGVVLAGCSTTAEDPPPVAPSQTAADELDRYYTQELAWQECGQRLDCAELTVPRDYADPAAGDLQIAVARYGNEGATMGSLVFNPGGPGGSGVEFAEAANLVVSPKLLDAYDFVGFDPRGVGKSDPIDCLTDAQTDEVIAGEPDPRTDEQIAEFADDAELIATSCEKRSGDILAYIDSESVVRDMDILRAALGDEQLTYLGKSYGTKLGALYADLFPDRVGRMVLDGVLPPDLRAADISLGQAKGFEDSLRRYVEWCQNEQTGCPLTGDGVDAGVNEIQRLLAKLEFRPIPAGSRELTEGLALQAIVYYLYFPYAGDWQRLNSGLRNAFSGDGTTLLRMLDERLERSPSGDYKNNGNSYDAFMAITCVDDQGGASVAELKQRAQDWADEAPTFGPALSWSELVCDGWPVPAKGEPRTVSAAGSGPILVVSTSHDPATPLPWAEQLVRDLSDAALVVLEGDGHTAYYNGSSCMDSTVDDYLVAGTVPLDGKTCADGRQP